MSNYSTGHEAEKTAAKYLEHHGFIIKDLNWKTKYCEIDIIAEKQGRLFFTEVKYRQDTRQGSGLEYITAKKLRQMRFAAEMWVSNHQWEGEYQLAAIGIDGGQVTFVDEL